MTAKMTRIRILPVKPIRTPNQGVNRGLPFFIRLGSRLATRLAARAIGLRGAKRSSVHFRSSERCLAEPRAFDGRRPEMVTLQVAETLCPRDRLVCRVFYSFGHRSAAETADQAE